MTKKQIAAIQEAAECTEEAIRALHNTICDNYHGKNCTKCSVNKYVLANHNHCPWVDLNDASLRLAELQYAIDGGEL